MTKSSASAVWRNGLKGGTGRYHASSGAFRGEYSFATRFEGAKGTTPEELIAAAHAACFSMALAAGLEKAGTPSEEITTTVTVTLDTVDGKPTVVQSRLETRGRVPGIDQARFAAAAEEAKNGCPISRALSNNVRFELEAKLE